MEAAIDAGTVGTWEWDVREDRFVAGPAFAETFGVDPAAAQEGVSLERFVSSIHANDRDRVESAIQAAIDACDSYEQEYRVHNAAGELRWVLARGHVECDEDGTAIRFPGALMDITEKKRAEHELQRHEAFLEVDRHRHRRRRGRDDRVPQPVGRRDTGVRFDRRHRNERVRTGSPGRQRRTGRSVRRSTGVSGASERAEARFRTADGEWRWLEVHGTNQLANPPSTASSSTVGTSPNASDRSESERR